MLLTIFQNHHTSQFTAGSYDLTVVVRNDDLICRRVEGPIISRAIGAHS